MLWSYAIVFAATYLLELPVYFLLLRRTLNFPRVLLACLLLNVATHPLVFFVFPRLFSTQVHYVLVAEAFAVIVEALLLIVAARRLKWADWPALSLFGAAFLANALSATVGEIAGVYLLERLTGS